MMNTATEPKLSRYCAQGTHGFCPEDRTTCACTRCHRGPCERCGRDNLQKMYADDTLCASCYRVDAAAESRNRTTKCDGCGAPGAFRNPAHRRNEYLCSGCHAASGEPVVLTSSVAHFVAPCKGADLEDERHVWVHVRGTRFNCICGAKKYDAQLRAQRRRELERELF